MDLQQAKAAFGSQFLNQDVLVLREGKNFIYRLSSKLLDQYVDFEEGYLCLRQTSDLKDEECIEVSKILMGDRKIYHIKRDKSHIDVEIDYNESSHHIFRIYFDEFSFACVTLDYKGQNFLQASRESFYVEDKNLLAAAQYFTSIGILLQFTYLNEQNKPIILSPEELISMGWVVVKTN